MATFVRCGCDCREGIVATGEPRNPQAGQRVVKAMQSALPNKQFSGIRSKPRKFADWLKRTMRRLKGQALPPERWERGLSPTERVAAQRRISELTDTIAAPVKKKQY